MGKVNVYLPDDLERAVRDAGVPISSVCQSALRAAVDAVAAIRTTGDASGLPSGADVTPRLADILATAPSTALDLLGAVILHGENLGARVLTDLGVELPPPRPRPRAKRATGPSAEVRDILVAAYLVALELHHDRLGAEHVVIALAGKGSPTADLFAGLGLDERSVRARVVHLLANPWRADAPGSPDASIEQLDRFEHQLQRMAAELETLRSSAELRRAPPTTSA